MKWCCSGCWGWDETVWDGLSVSLRARACACEGRRGGCVSSSARGVVPCLSISEVFLDRGGCSARVRMMSEGNAGSIGVRRSRPFDFAANRRHARAEGGCGDARAVGGGNRSMKVRRALSARLGPDDREPLQPTLRDPSTSFPFDQARQSNQAAAAFGRETHHRLLVRGRQRPSGGPRPALPAARPKGEWSMRRRPREARRCGAGHGAHSSSGNGSRRGGEAQQLMVHHHQQQQDPARARLGCCSSC